MARCSTCVNSGRPPASWRSKQNVGVAAGNNAGIRAALEAGAQFILLLNNDADLRPSALAELRRALDAAGNAAWAAAPKILYRSEPDRIWSAGGAFEWWRGLSRDRGTGEPDHGQYDQPSDIDYANTCCLLVRAEVFARIGMMDEAYFMYYDDSDFSARVRRAGGRIRYVPSAQVLHDVQATSRSTAAAGASSFFALYYTTRNRGHASSRETRRRPCIACPATHSRSCLASPARHRRTSADEYRRRDWFSGLSAMAMCGARPGPPDGASTASPNRTGDPDRGERGRALWWDKFADVMAKQWNLTPAMNRAIRTEYERDYERFLLHPGRHTARCRMWDGCSHSRSGTQRHVGGRHRFLRRASWILPVRSPGARAYREWSSSGATS